MIKLIIKINKLKENLIFVLIHFQLLSVLNQMMSERNNNAPDPLNVFTIIARILYRVIRLYRLRDQRLKPLLDGLQPNQRDDPTRPEVRLERQMELDVSLIWNVYDWASAIANDHERHHLRRAVIQRSTALIDLFDNLLQTSVTEIEELEQQT